MTMESSGNRQDRSRHSDRLDDPSSLQMAQAQFVCVTKWHRQTDGAGSGAGAGTATRTGVGRKVTDSESLELEQKLKLLELRLVLQLR